MPAGDTDLDEFFDHGVSDGLPVVPPTRARVSRAVEMSGRDGSELVAEVPPNYGRATVEKIAVNAVMAGCRPEYLPVVIAAVDAICDPAFDLHGVSATTNAPTPLVVINGPVRGKLGVNCAAGVFGPGWRANATIGRAVRLVCVNLGGDKPRIRRFLWERLQRPVCELVPGRDGGDGLPEHVLRKFPHPETDTTLIPKFREPDNLKIVVAGGTAGRFSAIVPGWSFARGS